MVIALHTSAQTEYYWVKFADKNNNAYSITSPQAFLSIKSIERRTKQGIALDESDLPITQSYINSIAPYTLSIVHKLKWINTVVIAVNESSFNADSIRQFSFVDSLHKIEFPPSRSVSAKFEDPLPLVNHYFEYPNKYGIAYRQANMLNTDLLHQLGHRGNGVVVAVMDNGFNNVNNIDGFDSVRSRILGTWDFVNHEANVYTGGGHGTNVLSCIAANIPGKYLGTAPDASFYLLQSEDDGAEWIMEEYNWAAAAEWADSAGAEVFSTSLGYTKFDDDIGSHTYADLTGDKTVITHAGNIAFSKGILVINSAGNEGGGDWKYISAPADGDSVMAIGAVDSAEVLAGFSSRGPRPDGRIKPEVCAMGIRSAVLTINGDIGYSQGTSFSCPTLAGSAASLWGAFPDKTAREIYDVILASADRYNMPDNDYGYGIPDFYAAYLMLKGPELLEQDNGISVSPNPSNNMLYVTIRGGMAGVHELELYDMYGRLLLSQKEYMRNDTPGMFILQGYSNLAAGKYVLRVNGNRKQTVKVLKSN